MLTPQETEEIFVLLRKLAEAAAASSSSATSSTKCSRSRTGSPSSGAAESWASAAAGHHRGRPGRADGRPRSRLTVDRGESHPGADVLEIKDLHVKDERGQRGRPRRLARGPCRRDPGHRRSRGQRPGRARRGARWSSSVGVGTVSSTARTSPDRSPRKVHELSIAYVPADRHRFGLILSFSHRGQPRPQPIHEPPFSRAGIRNDAAIAAEGEESDRRIRHPDPVTRRSTQERYRAAISRRSLSRESSTAISSSSFSTSQRGVWTLAALSSSTGGSSTSATQARPFCSCQPSSTRCSRCPTASRSCTAASSFRSATPALRTRTRLAC